MLNTGAHLAAPIIGPGPSVGVDERRPRKTILPQIDGLRGIAICAVIFQHAFSHGISHALVAAGVVGFPYLVDDGWMGVSLFFILSGFVLSLPYAGAETKFVDPAETIAFYRRRARRLLPLFAIGCFVGYLINHTTLDSLLLALTIMSMFSTNEFFPHVNGPFWTLMLEIWFSISLPALMIAAVRFGYWRVFAAAAATALIIRLVGTQLSFSAFPGPYINPLKDSVPARIDDFVAGMLVAKLYRDGHLREALQWLFVPGAAVVVLSGIGWDLIAQGIAPRWVGGALNLVTSTGFACVMISCLTPRSSTGRVASWRPLRVVGAMCFSLYCWHFLVVQVINPNSLEIKRIGLFLLATAGISILSYRFIEFPQKTWRSLLMVEPNWFEAKRLAV
jgi:peptidoglycan/LPS O-acetylase OafA/YrhL